MGVSLIGYVVSGLTRIPVKMFWKAASTFEASSADVSMNDSPFSAIHATHATKIHQSNDVKYHHVVLTRKRFRLLSRYGPQVLQITFVAHKHNDNVRIGMVAEFLEPAGNVGVRRVLGNIVDEESAYRTAVVAA